MTNRPFRIVWLQQVWPKWQIVIPKEAREILELETWTELSVILKDNKHIWIVKNTNLSNFLNCMMNIKWHAEMFKIVWVVQLWPKWQIWIPKEARDSLSLTPWTDIATILISKDGMNVMWLIRNNDLQDFFNHVKQLTKDMENLTNNNL